MSEPVEEQARADGWLPEAEFKAIEGNESKKWRSAEEFMDRKSLFEKIDAQGKELKNVRQAQQELINHSRKIEQAAYERAVAELKAEKKVAAAEGDVEKVEEIRDKIDELDRKQTSKPAPVAVQPPQEFVEWTAQNPWYETNRAMRSSADAYGAGLIAQGLKPDEVLKGVAKEMKRMYPEQFRNPNKDSAPAVDGSTRSKPSNKGEYELSEVEETVMNKFLRARVPSRKDPKKPMTREEYIAELKAIKENT